MRHARALFPLVLLSSVTAPADAFQGASEPARRGLRLEDFYRIESVSSPAISPDGRRVAFVRSVVVESENRRNSEIWLAPADGSARPTRLTSPATSSTAPRWSPDGKLLAFSSRRRLPGAEARAGDDDAGSTWFLRMDEPLGEAFQIEGVLGTPIFSPDNQWIAFTRKAPVKKEPPRFASDFERQVHERFKGRIYDWMGFRFDGRGYLPDPRDPAASPPEELFLVARAGGAPRQLTRLGVNVQQASWRPDSRALVAIANTHQRDEHTYERSDVFSVTTDGETKRLTDDGYDHEAAAFSPDGSRVAFRRTLGLGAVIQSRQDRGAPVDLYTMPADGGALQNLTPGFDLIPGDPTWSPDGRYVHFVAGASGTTHLYRVPASGGAVEQVTRGDRRLSGVSASADHGRIAYVATDSTHPGELLSARADGTEERKLSGLNDRLLSELRLSPAERLAFESKDGTAVEGWVILPLDYDAAKGRSPLILSIHGGPHGAYGCEFSFPWQLWAAQGYAVLYTNPRGSTEYGEKFLWATWGGWGLSDTEDVLAGVDQALARYAIDEKRLGVAGYSYGGFLTNWIIGHTTRFAAAAVGAGVSNWVSDYGTADIPRTKESEFHGPPWEARSRDLLVELSPVHYAGAVTTPTLFVHGEADLRVPIEQGEQMYTALQKRRVPSRFVRYPEMYHGGWTPWNTVHRYDQELRWWGEHLRRR